MLLEKETQEEFGYSFSSLSIKSSKKIYMECDYCGEQYILTPKRRLIGHKVIKKDSCIKCKFKKREDVSLARDGVKNSAQRKDVKDKLSDINWDINKEKIIHMYREGYCISDICRKLDLPRTSVSRRMKEWGIEVENYKTKFNKIIAEKYGESHKHISEIAKDKGFSTSHFYALIQQHGIEKASDCVPNQSFIETIMEDWLISQKIEYSKQFRIENRIADFKLNNILVETDGTYWHSDAYKSNTYHAEKRQLYIDHGYTPLFFREDEINEKFPIVQSIILNKLGKSTRVFARKCEVKEVPTQVGREFVEDNHLMGSVKKGTFFGLYYKDELISIMSIYRKKGDLYEISRMCHKLNTTVVGGFSKLLKFAHLSLPSMKQLLTFIDLRYGSGHYLTSMGFVERKTHISFRWTNGKSTYHRMKFPASTGYEKGLFKLWDCGQTPWNKTF